MMGLVVTTVYILHGQNAVDLDDRLRELRDVIDPQGYSTTTLDVESASLEALNAALATPPFFGAARLTVLRGLPGSDRTSGISWDAAEPLLAQAPASSVVIMAVPQKIPSNRRILKAAGPRGWSVETFDIPYGASLARWLQQRAGRQGGTMLDDAARELLDRTYPTAWQREDRWNPQPIDMRLLATEVEKLVTASGRTEISAELVRALVTDRGGVTAFKLNDETFEGRPQAALIELDNVLSSGEAPERVLGQIGYQPLVLLAAGQVQAFGLDAVSAAAGISAGQLSATIGRKSAWRNSAAVVSALEELRRAEWLVKSGRAQSTATVLAPAVGQIAFQFSRGVIRRSPGGD
jgi:DNA polymerase III delta subunit